MFTVITEENPDVRPTSGGRVSAMFGQQIRDVEPLVDFARVCETQDVRLWLGQSFMIESHAALAAVAGRGVSVETGIGVALAPLRTPADAFTQASSVASLMGRSISVGYGMGSADFASRLLGREFTAPAKYMGSYVEQVQTLKHASENAPESEGWLPESKAVEVGCGVLRPRMAREAGHVADFAITWLTPPDYIASTITDALATGAAKTARKRPRLVSVVQCAVARQDRQPARLAMISCGQHIRTPHYSDMLRRAGVELTGDLRSDLRSVVGAGLFAYGSVAEIAEVVNSYWRMGVDEVVVNVGSVGLEHGPTAALHDMEEILEAVAESRTEEFASTGSR